MRTVNRRGDGAVGHSGQPNGRLVSCSADDGRDCVGLIDRLNRWCTADGARDAVDGQSKWKAW